tara:strand:+ start:485 stop:643 length:159 start_codon:yes stop_codon:yes gene_type:complete
LSSVDGVAAWRVDDDGVEVEVVEGVEEEDDDSAAVDGVDRCMRDTRYSWYPE